jgi:hypothetical protein
MVKGQYTICGNQQKLSPGARWIAFGVFVAIVSGFALLWASEKGYINLSYLFGTCGFKQRFGLPCPGCGWTHAAQLFATGHLLKAFWIQPAAGLFCAAVSVAAIFALHCAIFGIDFGLTRRIFCSKSMGILLAAACIVIIAGWIVTLIRTVLENSGP